MATLLIALSLIAADPLSGKVLRLVNEVRADAGVPPLAYDSRLAESARLWVNALARTGIMAHGWPVNASGRLIDAEGNVLSRVVLPWRFVDPDYPGGPMKRWTDFVSRNDFFGVPKGLQSENGATTSRPEEAVFFWTISEGHYRNMTNPAWTHAGAGTRDGRLFIDFAEEP